MISKAELKELEALDRTLCKVCGPKLKGWIEVQREKAAAKTRGTGAVADGPLDKAAFVRALTACSKLAARVGDAGRGLVEIAHLQDCIALYATDGETFVTRRFERPSDKPDAMGMFDARHLLTWLRSRKGKWMDARFDDGRLVLQVGNATTRFKPREVSSDFALPRPLDRSELRPFAEVFPSDLRRLLRVTFSASDKEMRYAMNAVYFEGGKSAGLRAVATNGRMLAISGPVEAVSGKGKMLVPLFAVGLLDTILRDVDEAVEVLIHKPKGDGAAWFAFSSRLFDVQGRQVEGRFPDFENAISEGREAAVTLDRVMFLAALKEMSPFYSMKGQWGATERVAPRITAARGGLAIRSSSPEHRGQRLKVEGEFDGERWSAAYLNPSFLVDALNAVDDERVTIEMRGFQAGASIKADRFHCFLMSIGTGKTAARLDRKMAAMKEANDDAK